MNPTTATELSAIVAATRYVLLDFDGPVCSIFAERSAPVVTRDVAAVLGSQGIALPADVLATGDPLDILRYAGRLGDQVVIDRVHEALRAAEMEAVDTAAPTSGADHFLTACRSTGRTVAVASNNSADAVKHYLVHHHLADLVAHVEGRCPERPDLMKPSPWLIAQAMRHVGADPAGTLVIGDSVTDLEAARVSGTRSVGYANQPRKRQLLRAGGAATVVTSMTSFADVMARIPTA